VPQNNNYGAENRSFLKIDRFNDIKLCVNKNQNPNNLIEKMNVIR